MWFQLFCFFHLVSTVCLTDWGSHFSFGTSICSLVFLSLPQAFVVCSFFLCHRHLCTVSFFHGLFCPSRFRVILFVFALLALVSGYECISQFLVSCCALAARQLHPWRFEMDFFSKSVTLWTALQISL